MARYSRIESSLWKDPDVRGLRPFAKLLYIWSFTNDMCGIAGTYTMHLDTPLYETDLRKSEFLQGWRQLLEYRKPDGQPMVEYDPVAGLFWVCGKFKRELCFNSSDPIIRGAAREIRRLPRSEIWSRFFARYGANFRGLIDFTAFNVEKKVETDRAYPSLEAASSHPIPSHPIPVRSALAPSALFVSWWDQYPRRGSTPKRGKAECWEYWRKQGLEEIGGRIMAGVAAELAARKQADASGEFMAAASDPIRWLKGKGWLDYEDQPAPKPVRSQSEPNALLTPEEIAQRRAGRGRA